MSNGTCPVHKAEYVFQPPGISGPNAKNPGVPYEGFWKCQIRGCKMRPGRDHASQTDSAYPGVMVATAPQPPQAGRTVAGVPRQAVSADEALSAEARKQRSISILSCFSSAAVAYQGQGWSVEQIADAVFALGVRLYVHGVVPAADGKMPCAPADPIYATAAALARHPNAPREPGEDSDLDFGEPSR